MRKLTIGSIALVFAVFSVAVWAAGPYDSPMQTGEKTAAPEMMTGSATTFTPEILKARDLIGMKVENPQSEHLGKIEDIVLTPNKERVAYAVLSYGGVMGIGDKLFAVPWRALEKKTDAKALILNRDKESLKAAPGFDKANWPSFASTEWAQKIREFYGQKAEEAPQATAEAETAIESRRVSKLLDTKVNNPQDQKIGELKDIAIDTHRGHLVYGIISLATPAPDNRDMAAIPWTSLTLEPQKHTALLDVNKTVLESVAFNERQYPNLADREFSRRTYEQFNRQPYWDVYGYTAPGGEARERMMMSHDTLSGAWSATSTYNKKFDPANVSTFKGTVQSVSSFQPEPGSLNGVQLTVKADDGRTMTVQLGPTSYLRREKMSFTNGDQVQITGCKADVNGQSVIMASEIQKGDRTLQLRSGSGAPAWHQMRVRGGMEPSGGVEPNPMTNSQPAPVQ